MNSKVKLKICVGTACYVTGGHKLADIKNTLPPHLKDKVSVEWSVCLGCDKTEEVQQPPYAEVNGKLIAKATFESILSEITKCVEHDFNPPSAN
jgi:NADH:ubiquinone oxidoreductase subunit E